MKLKTYQSESIQKAMTLVRKELGRDAIIVSSQATPHGVVLIAAQDDSHSPVNPSTHKGLYLIDQVIECLEAHNIQDDLLQKLVSYLPYATCQTITEILTQIFLPNFTFHPLTYPRQGDQWMLIGPPGVGKTVTVAKIAAHCMVKNIPVIIVSLDKEKAGAIDQIKILGRSIQANVVASTDPAVLHKVITQCAKDYVILIDTPGTNPYNFDSLSLIHQYVEICHLKPILVLNGIGNSQDLLDQTQAFSIVGADRIILTQMDLVRRLGAVLTLINESSLALCAYSSGPYIADLLTPLTAYSLADFMVQKQKTFFASQEVYSPPQQGAL